MKPMLMKDEVYSIIGAAMEVHREEGYGFSEPVFQECMQIECAERGLPVLPQVELPIYYKGKKLKKTYIADFVAYGKIIVELKALDRLTEREEAQVINYLKASKLPLGVIINFGAPSLEWKRLLLTDTRPESVDLQPGKLQPAFNQSCASAQ